MSQKRGVETAPPPVHRPESLKAAHDQCINAMDVRERLQSAPTLSNTLKYLIPNAWIAKNGLLTINAMAVSERL